MSTTNVPARIVGMALLVLAGSVLRAEAHNGAVAIAVPVEGIKIDGDLSDWPEEIRRYPIEDLTWGDPPKDSLDFQGSFQVGYNVQENAVYIAVEIQDESFFPDAPLTPGTEPDSLLAAQVSKYQEIDEPRMDEPIIYGGLAAFDQIHGVKQDNNRHRYEFLFNINKVLHEVKYGLEYHIKQTMQDVDQLLDSKGGIQLHSDMILHIDIEVHDTDEDGLLSSGMTWRGNVVLGEKDMTIEKALAFVMQERITEARNRTREDTTYQMLLTGMATAFTLLHFLLFLFYPKSRANLYYAIFLGAIATTIFLNFQYDYLRATKPQDHAFHTTALSLIVESPVFSVVKGEGLFTSGLLLLYSLYYTNLPKQFWVFFLSLIGFGLGHFIAPIGRFLNGAPALVLALAYFIEVIRVVFSAIIKKKDGAWILGTGFIAFLFVFLYRTYSAINEGGSEVFGGGLLFGAVAFFISMSIHLARNVARTSKNLEVQLIQNQELSAKTLEQERALRAEAEKELQTAHEMQMALMPKAPPQIQGFEITGRCMPANHVGGDLFQYFYQDRKLSVSLADVTGHAMAAAIPVVMFSGILKSQMGMGGTVEELFGKLNQALHGTLTGHTLVCLAMGQLDLATHRFRFSNAGCPYPYHYRAATSEVVELQMDAYPLGVRPDTIYRGAEVQLEPGDRVVFCSDGIAEAGNARGEMFGFERTAETVRRGCAEDLSAEALLARIIQEVKAFSGDVPQGDDQTVVVLKVDQ
ncbi:MAG: SpoIIE family protein phosphatase [Candidatus Latescibacteria bacterium]|nr:SpoIIE family protein phosphatase [Candidatus Latescibacterota bacterium]